MQKTILITGGTGLVGNSLVQLLLNYGYKVHIFTRNKSSKKATDSIQYFNWNPAENSYEPAALHNVLAIINLAGESVATKRWTAKRKEEILQSRVQSGNLVSKIIHENSGISTLIQASATGWYAPNTTAQQSSFQEQENAANDFLGQTCKAWEESIATINPSQCRVVTIRIGIVLHPSGGMLAEIVKPLKFGINPIFGNGKQIVPWVHYKDLCAIILYAIENETMQGVYNAVANAGTTQLQLSKRIATIFNHKNALSIKVPAFILKLVLGEFSTELLKSSTIFNDKIKKAGYVFQYPALENIIKF